MKTKIAITAALLSIFIAASALYSKEKPKSYIHLIMNGQSLSTGHESWTTISANNIKGNFMIGDQIWINYGNRDSTDLKPLVGSVSNSVNEIVECPLLGLANHIQIKSKNTLNIIGTSVGTSGEPIEDLSKESKVSHLYNDYLKALHSASDIVKSSGAMVMCPAIFWMQGEWNYQGHGNGLLEHSKPTSDKDEYKNLMVRLKNNMQNDAMSIYNQKIAPVFYTYQVGAQYTKGKQLSIGMAQLELSNQYNDIVCAGPIYPMTDVGGHLDANGYRWYGEMLGKVYYKTQILGEEFKPLQPSQIVRNAQKRKEIIVKYLVPQMPLVFDDETLPKEKDLGFEIYHNNERQAINNISIDKDRVILTCESDLDGVVEVIYGSSNTRGHGNLRDSDSYKACFRYDDLDRKDERGEYVYPRPDNKKLRPQVEPKDNKENIIYNKPYPLYNFSVAFYYRLEKDVTIYSIPYLTDVNK